MAPIGRRSPTAADGIPAWSPDGKRIAFDSQRSGNGDIYVMDVDGSNIVRLTSDSDVEEWPAWSPDGRSIVYQRKTTTTPSATSG